MTEPTKLDVPRPGALIDAFLDLEEVEEELEGILTAIRDRISALDSTTVSTEIGKLFNTSVETEIALRRLKMALVYLKEVGTALPTIRMHLNEVGMSS